MSSEMFISTPQVAWRIHVFFSWDKKYNFNHSSQLWHDADWADYSTCDFFKVYTALLCVSQYSIAEKMQ